MFIHESKIYGLFHLHPRHRYQFLFFERHLRLPSFISFPFPSSFLRKNSVIFILKMLLKLLFHFDLCFHLLRFLQFLTVYLLSRLSFSKPLLYFSMIFASCPFFLISPFVLYQFPS